MDMKVIGVTGMPGSGKGIVAGVAKSLGYEIIRMGDVIREEAKKRNAKIGDTAVQLRKDYGEICGGPKDASRKLKIYLKTPVITPISSS